MSLADELLLCVVILGGQLTIHEIYR